jgi:hypothetical protein
LYSLRGNNADVSKKFRATQRRPWARPVQAEFLQFGAKVHEGIKSAAGDWHQPFEQVERALNSVLASPRRVASSAMPSNS